MQMSDKKLEKYYLKEDQEVFTNRERELTKLKIDYRNFSRGIKLRLAPLGLRRVGKTLLIFESIRRQKKLLFIYTDFKKISFVPENFALQYIASCVYWIFQPKEDLPELYKIENLIRAAAENKEVIKYLTDISEALNKKTINRSYLFEKAINFPEFLAKTLKKKIVVVLDEFQEVLKLNKYEELREVIDKFRSLIQSQETGYILSGSAISLMERIIGKPKSALFLQFERLYLDNFGINSAIELITKLSKKRRAPLPNKAARYLYKLTQGHPFYLTILVLRVVEEHQLYSHPLDIDLVKKIFLLELTNIKSKLYDYFNYVYNDSLERARGSNLLRLILQYLAKKDGLRLAEISKLTNKELNITQNALNELIKVDLLVKTEDKRYYFKDGVFRQWLRYFYLGYQVDERLRSKFLEELIRDLEEKYLQVSTELGKAKEAELRERLKERFGFEFKRYQKGEIEIDALGYDKEKKEYFIVEIKHRNKPASYKDVNKFLNKVGKSEFKEKKKKLFFISKLGFTPEAEKLAKKRKCQLYGGDKNSQES